MSTLPKHEDKNEDEDEDENTLAERDRVGDLFAPPEFGPRDGEMPSMDWLMKNFRTKSGVIRYLDGQGFNTKQIAKHTGLRYQHVRNVQVKELKRGPSEVFHDQHWKCSHTKDPFIDVVVRTGLRDPSSDKVLFRICIQCAYEVMPGVTRETVAAVIPGVKLTPGGRKL
jgi:hypothetical protein